MVLAFDSIVWNDTFREPGFRGIGARSHGMPWPFALALALPVAHLWLLMLVVGRMRRNHRLERGQVLAGAAVAAAVGIYWLLVWLAPSD